MRKVEYGEVKRVGATIPLCVVMHTHLQTVELFFLKDIMCSRDLSCLSVINLGEDIGDPAVWCGRPSRQEGGSLPWPSEA